MAVADVSALKELFVHINSRAFMNDDGSEGCFPPVARKLMFQPCLAFLHNTLGHRRRVADCWISELGRLEKKGYTNLSANEEVLTF